MCGDFNATVDPYIDRFGCNPESPWANNWAPAHRKLMSTFALCDTWRACHPGVKEFTWRRTNGSQGSRIDMIWLPERYLGLVRKIESSPFLRCACTSKSLSLGGLSGVPDGGSLTFRCSKMRPFALESMTSGVIGLERRRFFLLSDWYEAGKVRLRRFIIDISHNLARENKSKFTELNSRLAALERRVRHGENLSTLLEEARAELDEYLSHQAQGAMLRAQVREAA